MQERHWLKHWAISHRFVGCRALGSLIAVIYPVKVFTYFTHVIDQPPRTISHLVSHVRNISQSLWSMTFSKLFQRLYARTQYLAPCVWVTHEILPPYSTNITKAEVFKQWKSSQVICSRHPYFETVEQYRPHCCRVCSTSDRQPDVTPMLQMFQIRECQCDPLLTQKHFIRCTLTKWDTTAQLNKSIQLTQLLPWENSVRCRANPLPQMHFTLPTCKISRT